MFLEECDINSQPLCGLKSSQLLGCNCQCEQLYTGIISFLTGLGAALPTSLQCRLVRRKLCVCVCVWGELVFSCTSRRFMYDKIKNVKWPHYPTSAHAEWLASASTVPIFFFNTDKPKPSKYVNYLGGSCAPPFIHKVRDTLQLITGVQVTLLILLKAGKKKAENE